MTKLTNKQKTLQEKYDSNKVYSIEQNYSVRRAQQHSLDANSQQEVKEDKYEKSIQELKQKGLMK